jgi:hypothetical protein
MEFAAKVAITSTQPTKVKQTVLTTPTVAGTKELLGLPVGLNVRELDNYFNIVGFSL